MRFSLPWTLVALGFLTSCGRHDEIMRERLEVDARIEALIQEQLAHERSITAAGGAQALATGLGLDSQVQSAEYRTAVLMREIQMLQARKKALTDAVDDLRPDIDAYKAQHLR